MLKNGSFWPNLGFGVAFSLQNNFKRAMVNSTNRWHTAAYLFLALLFSGNSSLIARKLKILISTRRILVLVVVFSFQILLEKVLKKWQLLVESWFWLLFFFSSSIWKNVEKWKFLSFWSNLGFGVAFFPKNNINRATVNSTNRWHTAAYLFLALLFP